MSLQPAARPLNPLTWIGLPILLCMLGTVLFSMPIRVFGLALPEPVFALAPTFAWAVIRPSMLAPFGVLIQGLFLDIYWGGPIGLWPMALLAGYAPALILRNAMVGQGMIRVGIWYAVSCALTFAVAYGFAVIAGLSAPNPWALAGQIAPTLLLFPVAMGLINRFEDADVRFR